MKTYTVRELGGAINAELLYEVRGSKGTGNAFDGFKFEAIDAVIDMAMEVLARYVGTAIVMDEDFPVVPRPVKSGDYSPNSESEDARL